MGRQSNTERFGEINEEEYRKSLGELAGSIASKAGHIIGIYDFFIKATEGNPYDQFPSFEGLAKRDLIKKWKSLLLKLNNFVTSEKYKLVEIPLSKGNFVNIELLYVDSIFHTLHHRGKILSFLRILGKNKEEIHPRDVNVDFLNYIFREQKQLMYSLKNTTT